MPTPKALPYCSATISSRRGFEHRETVSVGLCIGERRKLPSHLIGFADFLPHGSHDRHHLPMRHPFPIGAFTLLAFGTGGCALHAIGDTLFRTDRNVGFHAALPERELPQLVGCAAGAPHAVFID